MSKTFEPSGSSEHDERCCCPVCSGLCQDNAEFYAGTGRYALVPGEETPEQQPQEMQLEQLSKPVPCSTMDTYWEEPCQGMAHWQVIQPDGKTCPLCDVCILIIADMNDENEAFYQPALADIARRG